MDMSWPRRVTAAGATKTTASITVAGIVVFALAGGGKREESLSTGGFFVATKRYALGGCLMVFHYLVTVSG